MRFEMIVVLLMLLGAFGCLGKWGINGETHYICVRSKFIDPGGEGGSHYVIIAADGTQYEIDRSYTNVFSEQANPDTLYAGLEIEHGYIVETTGYRIGITYDYPLIQKITKNMGTCCLDNCSVVKA